MTTTTFTYIAITDETSVCECCGKSNLKRVVVMRRESDGEIVRYGVDCAAKAMARKKAAVKVEADAVAFAQQWLATHDAAKVASAVWNRFGFSTEAKDGGVMIYGIGLIKAA